MFAIMILGIGFIMIAAIFPVAIEQSRATVSETMGTMVAENGARAMSAAPQAWLDGQPDSITSHWTRFGLGSQQVCAADPRFAFIGFKRQVAASQYQLLAISVEARNTPVWPAGSHQFELNPQYHACVFDLTAHAAPDSSIIRVHTTNEGRNQAIAGALVLVPNDVTITVSGTPYTLPRGTVLRLASHDEDTDETDGVWPLLPSPLDGTWPSGATATNISGYIVGRGLRNPAGAWHSSDNPFEGPSIAITHSVTTVNK
jgi:Tfp pilus assembly protein PilV